MTPFSQPAESPLRSRRSWPSIAWKVVVMSAVAMALAVSLTAWQAARTCTKHRQRDARAARPFVIYPAPLDARGSAGVVVRNYGERVPTEEVRRMICPAMREVAP